VYYDEQAGLSQIANANENPPSQNPQRLQIFIFIFKANYESAG
jgi:hypothetical protein